MSQSYSVVKITPLPVSAPQYQNDLEKENEPIPRYETIGGILLDTKYVWTSNGPRFTVVNCKTGMKVAAWNFGIVVKDYSIKVICVDELSRPIGNPPLLIIGLESDLTGGMICIFDITRSRVLRAIQIDEKVTSFHVVDASYDKCPLPGPLRAFDGILSIGTAGGNVLLLDICRQTCDEVSSGLSVSDIRDEVNSCLVKTLFMDDIYSLELHKQVATENGEHLAIHLNATDLGRTPHFVLKGPKGEDRVHVNKEEVTVSALHYCPQLGSLLVGYNFGAWQLWNLINFQLVYTSPIYEENVPVSHFAIQEPCDDPRAFCYIWVVYSNTEPYHTGFPLAVLYSLNYDTKEWHEGYGTLYQDLTSCSVRFQTDLTLIDEGGAENLRKGAHCLRLQAITKSISKGGSLEEQVEETIALCYVVWSGWSSDSNRVSQTYMSLFDLNQWYKEQMPSSPRLKECGNYMTYVCLSKLLSAVNVEPTPFLDVRMDLNTLSQFFGSQKLEEHYYPASLAFKLCALRENDVVYFNNEGSQRALLSQLEVSGPSALIRPTNLFQQFIDLGLYPLFYDISHSVSLDDQRELLLNIALEQQLLGWLCRCASTWSSGSHSAAGCTLHFLLTWGWKRALVLKQNADNLSTPLFDYSGLRLDSNTHSLLSNCARQLKNLSTLFGYIVRRFSGFLLNPDIVKQQWESLQMVSVHMEVLQWLLNVGLLPECSISSYPRADEFERVCAPYPVDSLTDYYNERRTHLQTINKEHFSTSGSILFIDNLIELECGGHKVQKQWEEDDGTGLYPPPSLQSLLRIYLTEGVEISVKHCVVVYVFLDLAMTLDQSRYKPIITHLIKFPAVFQLSPSIIKITQAFWQLDHGDFSTAMEQLLDPLVCAEDLKMWHHRVALRALLAQKQHKFALLYLQVRQPAVTEVQDLCTVLSLFIANNMLDEAFHFQRQNRSVKNEGKLLEHFYRECDKKGEISSVIHLPLSLIEEEAFMKYLRDVKHPKLQDLRIFYYIQRSQYMDAFELNDKFNSIQSSSKGLKGQENMGFRDLMVKEFTDTLPKVSKSLMKLCREENHNLWKEVARPEPFSVFVHNTNEQAKYKSTVIHAVLSKAKETWTHPILNSSIKKDKVIHPKTEEMPFLNTPKAVPCESRTATPVIFPKITRLEEFGQDEDGPSPSKRFKPSPRVSVTLPEKQKTIEVKGIYMDVTCNNLSVKLDTPIIKRQVARRPGSARQSDEKFSVGTPQSILKVYNLVCNSRSQDSVTDSGTPANIAARNMNAVTSAICQATANTSKSDSLSGVSLGLTPRKPLPRTPRPGVRFDISRASSESSQTSEPSFEIIQDEAMVHSPLEGIQKRAPELKNTSQQSISEMNSKNSSLSTDEVFYSPDASTSSSAGSKPTNELQTIVEINENKVLNQQVSKELISKNMTRESKILEDSVIESPRLTRNYLRCLENANAAKTSQDPDETLRVNESLKSEVTQTTLSSPKTPRSRRSYKASLPEIGIRSSPRLRKSLLQTEAELSKENIRVETPQPQSKETELLSQLNKTAPLLAEESTQSTSKAGSPVPPKLRGRRSLSRQVLENKTFSKIFEAPLPQQGLFSNLLSSTSQSRLEVSYSKTETSFESKKTVELAKESLTVTTEETKVDSTDGKDFNTTKHLPKSLFEDSGTVGSDLKIGDTVENTLDTNSSDSNYNPADIAYISDPVLQSSMTVFGVKESSTHADKDISVFPFKEVVSSCNETLQEKSAEVEIYEKNNPQVTDNIKDQQEEFNAESEEEGNENTSGENEEKVMCDSDADTVLIETDLVADAANMYEDLSSDNNYGSADPQLNVFEISDDLDLNEGMCVGENVEILEIDTNYTSTNDEEVFADNFEVLSRVVAVNDNSSEQVDNSQVNEFSKNMQDTDNIAITEEVKKVEDDENEVIELSSSSDGDDEKDRYLEDSGNQSSEDSTLNSTADEQYEETEVEEDMYEEDSHDGRSCASDEIPGGGEHSEQDSVDEQDEVLRKEVLSESGSSREMSDDNSVESSPSKGSPVESSNESEDIKEEEPADDSSNGMEQSSDDSNLEIFEVPVLDVIPEETSDVGSDNSPVDIDSKSKENMNTPIEKPHLNVISVKTSTREADNTQSVVICEEIEAESCQLDIIPEETSETTVTHAQLTAVAEEPPESDADNCKLNLVEPVTSKLEEISVNENSKPENSETPTGLPDDSVNFPKSSNSENSVSVEQRTVIEIHPESQKISQAELQLPKGKFLNETGIPAKTQNVEPATNNMSIDVLDESVVCEETHDVKSCETREWLNETDVLDATTRHSAVYTFKTINDDSEFDLYSTSCTAASTDVLEKSDFLSSTENSNVINQTDILDRTINTSEKENLQTLKDNVADSSQLNDNVFENLLKCSTPARRSRRLSSLQPTTPEQLPMKRTRRSASFNISHTTEIIPEPPAPKDISASSSELPSARQLRRRSSSTPEITQTQAVVSPGRKRNTNINVKEMPLRKRILRSSSTDIEAKQSETESPHNIRNRRARSVNVDLPVIKEKLKCSKNEKTDEASSAKKTRKGDKSGSSGAVSTKSESGRKQKQPLKSRKSKSTITAVVNRNKMEAYYTTRRLTRRQAVLLEKTLSTSKANVEVSPEEHSDSDSDDSKSHERGPDLGEIDPIKLLDKPTFEGKRDSDEEKAIQESPSSSIPESPVGSQTTRRLRSRSSMSNTSPRSEVSTTPSLSEAVTSIKQKHEAVKRAITGVSTRTKQRSKSTDEAFNKTQSEDMPSPPKLRRTRRGSKETESGSDISSISKTRSLVETKKPATRRRTRAASLQHLGHAETLESPLCWNEKRSLLAKSDLPQIIEEQNLEPTGSQSSSAVPKTTKRNLRKRSSAK